MKETPEEKAKRKKEEQAKWFDPKKPKGLKNADGTTSAENNSGVKPIWRRRKGKHRAED